jgi:hypothetical protein
VAGVIASATARGSIVSVSASTSTSTGVAPVCTIASMVAKNVSDGAITSQPAPTPQARSAAKSASVPLDTATP